MLLIALSCAAVKQYVYIPSSPVVKTNMYRPYHREKQILSLPVVDEVIYVHPAVKRYMHRPVPSRQMFFTVLSRSDIFYLPCRPVMKKKVIVLYSPVPSRN